MIVHIIVFGPLAQAQRGGQNQPSDVVSQATFDAKMDAQRYSNDFLWLGAGCLFSIFAVGAAYLIVPSPNAMRLVGKSQEYIFVYTEEYRTAAHNRQLKYAFIGCGLFALMSVPSIIIQNYIDNAGQ